MNHVRFMFNRIKDYNLLYETVEYSTDELFENSNTRTVAHVDEYCTKIINDVFDRLQWPTKVKYLGCRERIANEVYVLESPELKYTVSLTVDTFHKKNARLTVDILPENQCQDKENIIDINLERLKVELKNRIITDWSSCTWLIDEQSEQMCSKLYPEFFRIENEIRAFAGSVLTHKIGINWLERFGLEKYHDSAKNLVSVFQQRVPEFDNVNADLISLTLESLFKIIFDGIIYEDEIKFKSSDFQTLEQILESKKIENIKQFIEKKRTIQYRIWEDVFVPYFDDADRFSNDVTKFINSRNHIAHNKLLSINAYNIIFKELEAIQKDLDVANEKFKDDATSNEIEYTQDLLAGQELEEQDDEREYWRSRVADETGIDVLDEDQIYEKFIDSINEVHSNVLMHFQYDLCFTIEDLVDASMDGETVVFRVICNANEDIYVEIRALMIINDNMGEESTLHLFCYKDNEVIKEAVITYVNGNGSEDDDFCIQIDCDSEYHDGEIKEFTDNLIMFVENKLNPYLVVLDDGTYGNDDCESVVADFPCQECGKYGVSIKDEFYHVGSCCICGFENDIKKCSLCGNIFNGFGGNDNICSSCQIDDKDGDK